MAAAAALAAAFAAALATLAALLVVLADLASAAAAAAATLFFFAGIIGRGCGILLGIARVVVICATGTEENVCVAGHDESARVAVLVSRVPSTRGTVHVHAVAARSRVVGAGYLFTSASV